MRIISLTFAGIGPFRATQTVDFEALDDAGIYLIAGRTGAGKSTILDAICFALYGSVPRFEGGQAHLRSDHSGPDDPTFAELEFEAAGRTFRIWRAPEYERPSKRGGGTTRQPAKVTLLELEDGTWQGVSTSAKEIGTLVLSIVGLTKDQFLMVSLLAQNRFHEFLLAKNDERQKVLRSLFGTLRFERLREVLLERSKSAGAELDRQREALAGLARESAALVDDPALPITPPTPDAAWFDALAAAFAPSLAEALAVADRCDADTKRLEAEHDQARSARSLQLRREAALDERRALDENAPAEQLARTELDAARRAEVVAGLLAAERRAIDAHTEAVAEHARARAEFDEAVGSAVDGAPDAATLADTHQALLGTLAEALALEKRIPALRAAADTAQQAVRTLDAEQVRASIGLEAFPGELERIQTHLRACRELAVLAPSRDGAVQALAERRRAAGELATAEVDADRAAVAHIEAAQMHAAASAAHADLVQRRFSGFAAELAAQLQPGEPCAVCGSTEHPSPAVAEGGGLVTEAATETARAHILSAQKVMDAASADHRRLTERVAGLRAEAGLEPGASLPADLLQQLDGALDRARSEAAEARQAETDAVAAETEFAATRAAQSSAQAQSARLNEQREGLVVRAAESSAERDTAIARVTAARAEHATVAERVAEVTRQKRAATALVVAAADVATRATAASHGALAADEALAEQGIPTRQQAAYDARTPAAIARLVADLAEADRRRAAADAILAEPALQQLPTEPVDTDTPAASLAASREQRDSALALAATLSERGRRLDALALRAHALLADGDEARQAHETLRGLAEAVDGRGPNTRRISLESFVLAARLEEIVDAANHRLATMTSGRYTLVHDDDIAYRNTASGLGIDVLDEYTGIRRAPTSLSGGETFLASLALALGLADVVTAGAGGVTLETLFIDEGFGSLDPETLEIALGTMDGLRSGGRTIGLISHVEAMKERIAVGLRVRVTDSGESVIEAV